MVAASACGVDNGASPEAMSLRGTANVEVEAYSPCGEDTDCLGEGTTLEIGEGSFFGMMVAPGVSVDVPMTGNEGLILGQIQSAKGSHSGIPDGQETTSVDNAWSFFGNTGMHFTTAPVKLGDDGKLDFTGWAVSWNGLDIPMGGDAFYYDDTSRASITCFADADFTELAACETGSHYGLSYKAHVPFGDASGFGGVEYRLVLTGKVCTMGSCDATIEVPSEEPNEEPEPAAILADGTVLTIVDGSNFSMMMGPGMAIETPILGNEGVILGQVQAGDGSHTGAPDGTETTSIDHAWGFFGNTGLHATVSPVVYKGDSLLDMSGWTVQWNGTTVPMGGDLENFEDDTGAATISCFIDAEYTEVSECTLGTYYQLAYGAHVPLGDASNFGGVLYGLNLQGRVCGADLCAEAPVVDEPVAEVPEILSEGTKLEIAEGSSFGMLVQPGMVLETQIVGNDGVILGAAQKAEGSHTGAPDGSEIAGIDHAWAFFGNTGMHASDSPVVYNGDGTLDFTGWTVRWNGITVPMGGDPENFEEDTGLATIACYEDAELMLVSDCAVGDYYDLAYAAHVPLGDASGFGGVLYSLHLVGSIR